MQTNSAALRDISSGLMGAIRPPRRMSVSEAARLHLHASENQPWDADTAPYMIRPMDETASREHNVVCFVGPARTGKTFGLILGRWVYTVACHPLDFAVIYSSEHLASDFSARDLARQHKWSAGLRAEMTGRASDNNMYRKIYRSGAIGVLGWPSNTQLASRTIPVMLLTDYGRWPANVGGEGSGFDQARKRTETAGSLAMTVVESSPSSTLLPDADIEENKPVLGQPLPHAFPPTTSGVHANICPIFNDGTREWWYVPCQSCGEYYPQNPSIERFSWGESDDPLIAAKSAGTVCCWCGAVHGEETKQIENINGVWIAEGQVIDCYGRISGESRLGKTYPSFALGGGAAAYQARHDIVKKYLEALATAKATNDENSLKFVTNADIGAPHQPLHAGAARLAAPLKKRAEKIKKLDVPEGVRFLLASVDVQKDCFVVSVTGFGRDRNRWIVDYYSLIRSERYDGDVPMRVNPAAYAEDWHLLDKLIAKSYPLSDGSGRRMPMVCTLCDSGGEDGVTDNAYSYWRQLDDQQKPLFRLVKGEGRGDKAPPTEQRFPDTRNRKDRGASHGDVPVLFINTDRVKDRLAADLSRDEPGLGYCRFPDWLDDRYYKGLTKEKKDAKTGKWGGGKGNEPWDLLVYADAGAIELGIDKIDWDNPPLWAASWDSNPYIIMQDGTPQVAGQHTRKQRLSVRGH